MAKPTFGGRTLLRATCALIPILAVGCTLPEDAKQLDIPLPDQYSVAGTGTPVKDTGSLQSSLNDPELDNIMRQALAQNISLLQATERVDEADAIARGTDPYVDISADLEAGRIDTGVDREFEDGRVNATVGLFGGRKFRRDAARRRVLAAQFSEEEARRLLVGNVATTYIDLRAAEATLALRQRELTTRRESLEAVLVQFEQRGVTRIDVTQAELLVVETQRAIPVLQATIIQQQRRLASLLGLTSVPAGLTDRGRGRIPSPVVNVNHGIPADILRNRPSIKIAEANYDATIREVTAAQAARFPSLSINGNIGVFDSGAGTDGSLSTGFVGINIPIFNQGALNAAVDQQEAAAEIAFLEWRQQVVTAVEEVEVSISSVRASRSIVAEANKALGLNAEIVDLVSELLRVGEVTVFDYVGAERDFSNARIDLINARRQLAIDVVRLQLALGRSWLPAPAPAAPAPAAPVPVARNDTSLTTSPPTVGPNAG
ncbi:MAG: TolC family protein [Pseudomonadota bacterium]